MEKVREERDDDLNKLLQFFRECKENNEHFYWDVDADPKTGVLKTYSGAMQARRLSIETLEMSLHLT